MIICAFDVETSGLRDPIRIVELAAVLIEIDAEHRATERAAVSLVVRPEGFEIPGDAARVHGITTELAQRVGVPLVIALAALTNLWSRADLRVAHNLEYDERVIRGEIDRLGRTSSLPCPPTACTKELATAVLNLPPTQRMIEAGYGNKPKAPRLEECYRFLFEEDLVGAHGALADARACARVYVELRRRGVVEL